MSHNDVAQELAVATLYKRSALLLVALMMVAGILYFNLLTESTKVAPNQVKFTAHEAKALGDEFYDNEQYLNALPYYLQAVEKLPSNTEYLRRLGSTYSHLNQFKLGEPVLNKAIAIDKKVKGAPVALAEDYFQLSRLYRRNSMYQEAYDSIAKALNIALEANLPADYQIKYRTDLAINRLWRGHYKQSNEQLKLAFELIDSVPDRHNEQVAALYSARGLYHRRMGKLDEALTDFNQALSINIARFGADNSRVARQRSNMGNVYVTMGEYGKALTQFKTALQVFVKVYGQAHQTVSAVYNNIANVLITQGKYAEAHNNLKQALEVNKALGNTVNRSRMHTLISLGEVGKHRNMLEQADQYFADGLNMALELFGYNHQMTAYTWMNMGDVAVKRGNFEKASALYGKALAVYDKAFGKEHQETRQLMSKMAELEIKIAHQTSLAQGNGGY